MFFKKIKKYLKYLKKINEINDRLTALETSIEYERLRLKLKENAPTIFDYNTSIECLLKDRKSIARFGDGEFNLIFNQTNIPFQNYTPELEKRLKDVLMSNSSSCYIGIPKAYYDPDMISSYNNCSYLFIQRYVTDNHIKLHSILRYDKAYCATELTQLYQLGYPSLDTYFDKVKSLWHNRDIVIVAGEGVLTKLTYNIFDCARSVEYCLAPRKNAFQEYNRIFQNVLMFSTEKVIIIILGPTASVLAYDLSLQGYQALDLGHIAKDYDSFMRKESVTNESIKKFFSPD